MSTKLKAFTTTDKIEYKNFNDLSCDELEYFITDRQSAKDGIKYLLSEGSIQANKPFTVIEYQRLKIKNDLLRDIHGV